MPVCVPETLTQNHIDARFHVSVGHVLNKILNIIQEIFILKEHF